MLAAKVTISIMIVFKIIRKMIMLRVILIKSATYTLLLLLITSRSQKRIARTAFKQKLMRE